MNITINNTPENIPNEINTISELVIFKKYPTNGTAIAIGAKLVKQELWSVTKLKEGDNLIVISAAFGG